MKQALSLIINHLSDEKLKKEALALLAADVKFINLPVISSQQSTDIYAVSANGAGSFQESRAQQNVYWNANIQLLSTSKVTGLDAALASKLNLSGSNSPMTGFLTLNADPVSNLQAATKQYVDASVPNLNFQQVYNNSSPASFNLSAAGFTILDPNSHLLFQFSTTDGGNTYTAFLEAQNGTYIGSILGSGGSQFTGSSIINSCSIDFGASNPNFTLTAQSSTPSGFPITAGNLQFGFSDESSSPSGFFKINLIDQGAINNIIYASGAASGNPPLVSFNSLIKVGPSFSPVASNFAMAINGLDASTTKSAGLNFFTSVDNYPLMQILPFTHGTNLINFDCYSYNGTYYSSYAGSNFQIAKSNNQLQINMRSGINPGGTFGFQQACFWDTLGTLHMVGKLIMGNPAGTANALAQFNSSTYGILPPSWPTSQESLNTASFAGPETGMQWFNSTTLTNNYWDGSTLQQILTIQHLNAGSNITFDNSVPGQLTINGTGGGTVEPASFASWAIQNNPVSMTVQTSFTPIALPPDGSTFFDIITSDFNNQIQMVAGISTAISTYTGAATQYFNVNANVGLVNGGTNNSTYIINISILKSGGSLISTAAQMSMSFPNFSQNLPEGLSGIVQLSTGDSVLLQIVTASPANCRAAYINFQISSIAGSISNTNDLSQGTNNLFLSQNGGSTYQYLSGAAAVGNIPQFNSVGGRFVDSGIPASSILTSATVAGGSLGGTLPNPSLSSVGISQVITITQVSGSTQTMVDSAPINRYILQNSSVCTFTLPASITTGHSFEIIGGGTAGWILAQNSGQSVALGALTTTPGAGGSLASTQTTDSLILTCTVVNTQLIAHGVQGNITVI